MFVPTIPALAGSDRVRAEFEAGGPFGLVHISGGRINHRVGVPTTKTVCGRYWHATVVGPPSTTRRLCSKCDPDSVTTRP